MSASRSSHAALPPILRLRLSIVAVLVALATAFFSVFRAVQPDEWAYFVGSPWGLALVVFEALVGVVALSLAALLRWKPRWWSLERLWIVEYGLVAGLALYIGWTQIFAFDGARFATAASDALLVR